MKIIRCIYELIGNIFCLPGIVKCVLRYGAVLLFLGVYAPAALSGEPGQPVQADGRKTSAQKNNSLDALFNVYQPYLENISGYEPVYFLMGADPAKTKFQISFKFKIFNHNSPFVNEHSWLEGIHFAYTQTSFWNLASASWPFEDTSYKPEFFFLSNNLYSGNEIINYLFLQAGIQHESNGRAEMESRSTNTVYIEPIMIRFNEEKMLGIELTPRFWTYVANEKETNWDLNDYRGNFALKLKVGRADRLVLESHFRPAREGNSVQVDLTYPIGRYLSDSLNIYFHAQYANALAESLLHYKERTEAVRFGISIIR